MHSIRYGGAYLDVLIEDHGAPTSVVIFHAARSKNWQSLPVFSGLQMMEDIHANVVCLSDPVLDTGLDLALFAGDRHRPLQRDLPNVIRHVLAGFGSHRHLVFFGAFGGGYAALTYSHGFPGSLALPANPQTVLSRYTPAPVQEYAQKAWEGVADIDQVPVITSMDQLYRDGFPNTVGFIQNFRDAHHRDQHIAPWMRAVDSHSPRLHALLDDWGKGHVAPPVGLLHDVIEAAAASDGDWTAALDGQGFVQAPGPRHAATTFLAWKAAQKND